MLEDRDFLLRTIRNLVDGMLGQKDQDVAAMESRLAEDQEAAGAELLGPGAPPLVTLSEEALVAALTDTEAGAWRLTRAGAVMLESGALADAAERPDALDFWIRALRCYLEAGERPASRLPAGALTERLSLLLLRLRGVALSEATERLLLRYFERSGRCSELEDLLFDRVERGLPGAAAEGRAALERLATWPEDALVAGGLSREEVAAALEELPA